MENSNSVINYAVMGAKIRAARKSKKMTQGQIAALCGISAAFFGHIERGTRIASIETLVAIARALQVSVDSLVWDAVPPTQEDCYAVQERSDMTVRSNETAFMYDEAPEKEPEYCYLRIEKESLDTLAKLFSDAQRGKGAQDAE